MSKAELLLALVHALLSEFQDELDGPEAEQDDSSSNSEDENEPDSEDDEDLHTDQAAGMSHIQQHYLKQSG